MQSRKQSPKWRRLTLWLLVAAVSVALLTAAGLLLGLRSAGFRQAVLRFASDTAVQRSGIAVAADDFRLRLRPAVLEVEALALSRSDSPAEPFLTVPRMRAEWTWRSLLAGRLVVRSLDLERPLVDLAVPLPGLGTGDDAAPGESLAPAIEILKLEITGGSILGGPASERLDVWLDSWRLDALQVSGSYQAAQSRLRVPAARLIVASHRRGSVELQVQTELSTTARGELVVHLLEVTGDGLDLEASGGGLGGGPPVRASDLLLRADLGELFPDLTPDGEVELSGDLALDEASTLTGSVELRAQELPGALLEPWTKATVLERFEVAATAIDADGGFELSIGAEPPATVTGALRLDWRRGGDSLLLAEARALTTAEGEELALAIDACILPGWPGSRALAATLQAPSWRRLDEAEIIAGRLDLDVGDLGVTAGLLGLEAEAIEHWGLAGAVAIDARAAGAVLSPSLRAQASWDRDGERILEAAVRSAHGAALTSGRPVTFDFEAALLPDAPGRRRLDGALRTIDWTDPETTELLDVVLSLDLPDLKAAWTKLTTGWPVLRETAIPPGLAAGSVVAAGRAVGVLASPELTVDAAWHPGPGESVELSARGAVSAEQPFVAGPFAADLRLAGLDLSRTGLADDEARPFVGRVSGTAELAGTPAEYAGHLELAAEGLRYEGQPGLESLRLEATTDGAELELTRLAARFDQAAGGGRLAATAAVELARPIRRARANVELLAPDPRIARATAELSLVGGTVRIEPLRLEWSDQAGKPGEVALTASLPIASLLELAQADDALGALPVSADGGPLTLELAEVDLAALGGLLLPHPETLRIDGVLGGALRMESSGLETLSGELHASGLRLAAEGGRVEASATVRLAIAEGSLLLRPVLWRLYAGPEGEESRTQLETGGEVRLARGWAPEAGWHNAIEELSLMASGAVDAALLNPFLEGGVGSGELSLEARFEGPPDALTGTVWLDGPDAFIFFPLFYRTRLEAPRIEISLERGRAVVETAHTRLNRGTVRLTGGATPAEGVDLGLTLEDVFYRLDYGLTTLLSADLRLRWPIQGSGLLAGELVIQRGRVRRDLLLDRELLNLLIGPGALESTEPDALDDLRLDLTVSTLEGVSIRNNLADLQVDWDPLRVLGTIGEPLVRGRFEVDPGGRITAYGQTVRIDEGSLTLSGDPDIEPQLILETTSSLEDPTLNRDERWYSETGWGNREAWEGGSIGPGQTGRAGAVTAGVTTHYTERLAAAMGEAVSATEVSYQALPIFGETDTQARWTLSQRLSPHVTYINSRNPREAQGTTNLVDLHAFAAAPGVVAQIFNDDDEDNGATLQQTLQLGGRAQEGNALRRISVEAPPEVSPRRMRRAAGFRKGDPFPAGADFDVEVDVADDLRRQGYPGSQVRAVPEVRSGLVDLRLTIEPGPWVRVVFEGDAPPRALQRSIAALYHPEPLAEAIVLGEMRKETVGALRSSGFLAPEVEIQVERDDPAVARSARTVRVRGRGGRRIEPGAPEFIGIDHESAAELVALFDTTLERVELAAGTPGADSFLRQALHRQGYPDAEVVSRRLSAEGTALEVVIEPGARRVIGDVSLTGLEGEEAAGLLALVPLLEGEPLRTGRAGRAAAAIERDLRNRGYADARVELEVTGIEAHSAATEKRVAVRFQVEPGPIYRIAGVRFDGLQTSDEQWVDRSAGLEPGTLLTTEAVGDARRRLYRTGAFQRIGTSTERLEAAGQPGARGADESTGAVVAFDLDERARYSVSYGARWESGEDLGAALYLSDRNFLGRGRTLGLRMLYMGENDKSIGLYHAWPRVGGSRSLLELFAQAITEVDSQIVVEGLEGWAQLTIPLSHHRQTRLYTLFQDRSFTAEIPDPGAPPEEDSVNLFLGGQYVFDSRDRTFGREASKGIFLGLDLSGSAEALGSDFDELRLFAQAKLYQPLGQRPLHTRVRAPMTWAQSVRLGLLEPFGRAIPRVDRLEAGGEYSVRGYRTDSLGPLDADGEALGGEVFFILNEELHVPLWRSLAGVVFFDAGNVWATKSAIDSRLLTSAGLGLRSPSPIGPLRLDLAFPLDRRPGIDPEYKVYLGFGPTF